MTIHDLTSTCNVIDENPVNPIAKGDSIQAPFIPIPEQKRFVVAGTFPQGTAYTRDQLTTLIKLNGGVVQDHVDLFTDFLILGETAGAKAGAESENALTQEQMAKELTVPIVDYRDFMSYIRR